MLETYKSDTFAVAARQIEVTNYAVLAELSILGWDIEVASSQDKPVIIFRASDWDGGRQPRFAVTAADPAEFRKVLLDLIKLDIKKRDQMSTVGYDEPLWISGGLAAIPKHDPDVFKAWESLSN